VRGCAALCAARRCGLIIRCVGPPVRGAGGHVIAWSLTGSVIRACPSLRRNSTEIRQDFPAVAAQNSIESNSSKSSKVAAAIIAGVWCSYRRIAIHIAIACSRSSASNICVLPRAAARSWPLFLSAPFRVPLPFLFLPRSRFSLWSSLAPPPEGHGRPIPHDVRWPLPPTQHS